MGYQHYLGLSKIIIDVDIDVVSLPTPQPLYLLSVAVDVDSAMSTYHSIFDLIPNSLDYNNRLVVTITRHLIHIYIRFPACLIF